MSGPQSPNTESNSVSGVAMSIRHSNYRCVEERPATTVDERQHSLNSILLAQAAGHSQTKPDESRTGRPTFIEDFFLNHSRFAQKADSISSGLIPRRSRRRPKVVRQDTPLLAAGEFFSGLGLVFIRKKFETSALQ